ncbi:MAG: arginase family protein [Proteobacteria bacterium]|nr:arginase family protein [Pseudomonadota bacterium]
MPRKVSVLGAPSSAGSFAPGQEGAPAALRAAGLLGSLRARWHEVEDLGDTGYWRWRPDRQHPRAQNAEQVRRTIEEVTQRVAATRSADRFALVLGGDCTIEIGTVAGVLRHGAPIGLIYFDMHADMNTPDGAVPGALDWMGVAHLLNLPGSIAELAGVSGTPPMLQPSQVIVLGYRDDQATPFERRDIEKTGVATVPLADVARSPVESARRALDHFADRATAILVHFDVDVIDFTDAPLSENTGRNIGLSQDAAFEALGELLTDPRVVALTVTELNPQHGEPDGSTVRDFAIRLAKAFG